MPKNHSIQHFIFCSLLIMFGVNVAMGQNTALKDTIYTIDDSFENQIKIKAKDSLRSDFKNNTIELFTEATLEFEEITLKAGYMLIDLTKKEVFASYRYDKDSNRVGLPVFTDGTETIDAASMRYNFDTKKGYIQEVKIKQEEVFLYMGVAKRQANEEVHFKQGRFTTCSLDEPHYHFQLSRAILIPEKRIVSGPMNLWIKGVPTPVGLPFIFIPQKKQEQRKSGILFPQFIPFSPYGIGVQDLGYYLPINDSLHTTFRASAFTRGSWGIANRTEYLIKYKFSGAAEIRYDRFSQGFPNTDIEAKLLFFGTTGKIRKQIRCGPLALTSIFNQTTSPKTTSTHLIRIFSATV